MILDRLSDKVKLLGALGAFVASFLGLVVVAVLFWSADRRADKLDEAINGKDGKGGYIRDIADCRSTVAQQADALKTQNDAIGELQRQGIERQEAANEAIRKAQQEAKAYQRKAERIAKARPGPDVCQSARSLIVETLEGER